MRKAVLTVVAMLFGWDSATSANLLSNGSFEGPLGPSNWTSSWIAPGTPLGAPTNQATDGSYDMHFGSGSNPQPPPHVISQSFSTAPGQQYQLEFDYGAFGLAVPQYLQVSVLGQTSVLDVVVTHTPQTYPSHSWHTEILPFIADSSLSTLTFADAGDPWVGHSTDGVLDRVSIIPIPEPSAALLFGMGLVGLTARRLF